MSAMELADTPAVLKLRQRQRFEGGSYVDSSVVHDRCGRALRRGLRNDDRTEESHRLRQERRFFRLPHLWLSQGDGYGSRRLFDARHELFQELDFNGHGSTWLQIRGRASGSAREFFHEHARANRDRVGPADVGRLWLLRLSLRPLQRM